VTIVSTVKAIFDLFCGTGGFSAGFEASVPEAFSTRFGVDILPIALDTFRANHSAAETIQGDIRKISCKDVERMTGLHSGDVSVIMGGPPCQGFSSIRPFRATKLDDPRNTLFEQFANFVNYFQPPVLVLENVVGLATHKDGRTLDEMMGCFTSLGYECDWRILNAAHFGVPQKRERLILMGVAKGLSLIFPQPTHECSGATIGYRDRKKMLVPEDLPLFRPIHKLLPAVTVMDAIGDLPVLKAGEAADRYDQRPSHPYQIARRKFSKSLTLHSSTKHSDRMREIIRHAGPNISYIPPHLISSGFSSCYSRLDADKPSVTITVNFVHPASNRCIHPFQDRALTPREGARLQSFDDTYNFCGSRTQIVKQIGNAVPPLLGKAVGLAVAKTLGLYAEQVEDADIGSVDACVATAG